MKKSKSKGIAKGCLLASLAALSTSGLNAADLNVFGTNVPPVDFHGFANQGYIWNSGNNDYLGGRSHQGTPDFREYGVNASIAYNKLRVGAQVFAEKLGPYGDDKVRLDWGTVDYQAFQWFGLRAGRVKMPRGLYNEALDLDSTRPFVLLPQSVYDARLRDFQASFDGGMGYGNIEMKQLGSLDYKVFGGHIPMSIDSGASDYFNIDAPFRNLTISMDDAFGGSLFWNTPLQGLRAGYSYSRFENFTTLRYVPSRHANAFKTAETYDRHLASVEYTTGNWVFAAEGGFDVAHFGVGFEGGSAYAHLWQNNYYYYGSATYRATRWLELGGYYSKYYWDQDETIAPGHGSPLGFPQLKQGDFALAASFDLTEYLKLKLEAHYMDGSGEVFNVPSKPQPPGKRDNSWVMLATKVCFSF